MAREKVTFKVNLRQNQNTYTSAYGHYYAEPDVNEPLNLKGLHTTWLSTASWLATTCWCLS